MTNNPTFSEIQAAIDALPALMTEKGVIEPAANVRICANDRVEVCLKCSARGVQVGSYSCEFFYGYDPLATIEAARAYIEALPDIEEANQRLYMDKVAETIDLGATLGIDDKYVEPLRQTRKAMTENLLTSEVAK